MVLLKAPAGTYTMGDTFGDGASDELPTHQVTVGEFYIGKYEVTQGQWQAVMGSNPSSFSSCGADCPVESVNLSDVQTFITTLNQLSGKNYRLPTEAEWEYAARSGGQSQEYSGGSDINAVAWYASNSGGTTHPVGQLQANGLGLYDMSGNVDEWVSDLVCINVQRCCPDEPDRSHNGHRPYPIGAAAISRPRSTSGVLSWRHSTRRSGLSDLSLPQYRLPPGCPFPSPVSDAGNGFRNAPPCGSDESVVH